MIKICGNRKVVETFNQNTEREREKKSQKSQVDFQL